MSTGTPPRLTGLRRVEAQLLAARRHLASAARTAREELPGLELVDDIEDAFALVRDAERAVYAKLEDHPSRRPA